MAQRPILERKNVFDARLIERRAAQRTKLTGLGPLQTQRNDSRRRAEVRSSAELDGAK
jgi:hypothetical protein